MLSYNSTPKPSNTTDVPNRSLMTKPHKFFERYLDNDLDDLSQYLLHQYDRIERGELIKGKHNEATPWDSSQSTSTKDWNLYNAFQFQHPAVYRLVSALAEVTKEACEYYDLDFKSEQFYAQSWFNVNYAKKGKLDWHEHGGKGAPHFHGYYSVKAEPSITHYKLSEDTYFDNVNKNNRLILSETGHPHAMADWSWDGPRITIAYDVMPLRSIDPVWEQHWIPLV